MVLNSGLEAELALGKALALLRETPEAPLAEFENVDRNLRSVLGDNDPFWIRWSQNLETLRGKQ